MATVSMIKTHPVLCHWASYNNPTILYTTIVNFTSQESKNPQSFFALRLFCSWLKGSSKLQTSWYKGWWKNSLRDGYGEAKFPSGGSYKGEWRDGTPEGYGIRKYASGKIEYGVFENGNLVKPMPKGIVLLKLQKKKNDL